MPNQRKKGKKFVGAWLPEKLYSELQRLAKQRGIAASTIVDDLLTSHVNGSASTLKDSVNSNLSPVADNIVSGAISEVVATPAVVPVSYKSPKKAARPSKSPRASGSPKKAL